MEPTTKVAALLRALATALVVVTIMDSRAPTILLEAAIALVQVMVEGIVLAESLRLGTGVEEGSGTAA